MDIIFLTGTILTGHYFAASVAAWAYAFSQKLLSKTEDNSKQSLTNVFGEQASRAWVLSDGVEVEVPFESLSIGDLVVVYAGETIPVDGIIRAGRASVEQRILTGESQPVEKEAGDEALARTMVLSGKLEICVQKTGQESVAAQITEILSQTAEFKNDLQSWGEELADNSALPALTLGALTLPILGVTSAVTILNSCFGFYMRILGQETAIVRDWFTEVLKKQGLNPQPSVCNFFLCYFPSAEAAQALSDYLRAEGIVVRIMRGYGLSDCVRITLGKAAQMRDVMEVLQRYESIIN